MLNILSNIVCFDIAIIISLYSVQTASNGTLYIAYKYAIYSIVTSSAELRFLNTLGSRKNTLENTRSMLTSENEELKEINNKINEKIAKLEVLEKDQTTE